MPRHIQSHGGKHRGVFYLVQFLVTIALVYCFLGARRWDKQVPLGFSSDGLYFNALGKAVVDEGWWFTASHAGYPFTAEYLAFPSNANVDFVFVRLASLGTSNAPLAMALAWMAMLATGGVMCTACLRILGVSRPLAVCAGMLFGLMPFAIYRGVTQFSLCPYLIPLPATLALLVWAPERNLPSRGTRLFLYAGCVLIGFNYIYNAFFAAAVLALAFAAGLARRKSKTQWSMAAIGLALVLIATAINLVPSFASWRIHGIPPNIREKLPMEFDYYGLKLRHLVTPLWEHSFPPFRSWVDRDSAAHFPLETENATCRLGFVGGAGFLFLLASAALPVRFWSASFRGSQSIARGILVALLLYATVGGLGAVFNLLVSPDIRAANRVTPWLAYFSLFALFAGIDSFLQNTVHRIGPKLIQTIVAAGVLLVGLYDQSHAFIGMRRNLAAAQNDVHDLAAIVAVVESLSPTTQNVLQYPFTTFLNDDGRHRMGTYDHLRPQLFAHKLRWSYPTISQQGVNWEAFARSLRPAELLDFARASGFDLLWVDRFGLGDGTDEADFSRITGKPVAVSADGRYAVFSLAAVPAPSVELQHTLHGLLTTDIWLKFSQGFYNPEVTGSSTLRWSHQKSRVTLHNHSAHSATIEFHVVLRTLASGPVNIRCTAPGFSNEFSATNQARPVAVPLSIAPGETASIDFEQLGDTIRLPNDSRDLFFAVIDPYLTFK